MKSFVANARHSMQSRGVFGTLDEHARAIAKTSWHRADTCRSGASKGELADEKLRKDRCLTSASFRSLPFSCIMIAKRCGDAHNG